MSELHPCHGKPETIHNEKPGWETGPDSLRNQAITLVEGQCIMKERPASRDRGRLWRRSAPLRCGPPDSGWLTSVSKRVDLNNGIFALGER
jgi:hypothetical protein